MSNLTPSKRKHDDRSETQVTLTEINSKTYNFKISNVKFLPTKCLQNVFLHCNSIYVGSEVRFWESQKHYRHNPGKVGQVHFVCQAGLYMSFFETQTCEFKKIKPSDRWYVNQRSVMAGAMLCLTRPGSDNILMDSQKKNERVTQRQYSLAYSNDVYFRYPTVRMQQTYECQKYKKSCWCSVKKHVKRYRCSDSNTRNPGRAYFGCRDFKTEGVTSCGFFAWEEEFDHGHYETCDCGQHCKRIEKPANSNKFVLICFERNTGGCYFENEL